MMMCNHRNLYDDVQSHCMVRMCNHRNLYDDVQSQ